MGKYRGRITRPSEIKSPSDTSRPPLGGDKVEAAAVPLAFRQQVACATVARPGRRRIECGANAPCAARFRKELIPSVKERGIQIRGVRSLALAGGRACAVRRTTRPARASPWAAAKALLLQELVRGETAAHNDTAHESLRDIAGCCPLRGPSPRGPSSDPRPPDSGAPGPRGMAGRQPAAP